MQTIKITEIDQATEMPDRFREVYQVWCNMRASDELPPGSGFSLEHVPPKLLPWSVLVDVVPEPLDFQFRFWGTERTNLIGAEMTGKLLSNIADETMRDGNREEYEEVLRRRTALLCHTPIVKRSGVESSRLSIRLPFSNDGRTVSRIYSAIDPDMIDEDHYAYYGTTPRRGM